MTEDLDIQETDGSPESPQQYEVSFTLEVEEGHFWADVASEFAGYSDGEGHRVTYTIPAVSQRLAEEYAGIRFAQDMKNCNREHVKITSDTLCEDPSLSLGDD